MMGDWERMDMVRSCVRCRSASAVTGLVLALVLAACGGDDDDGGGNDPLTQYLLLRSLQNDGGEPSSHSAAGPVGGAGTWSVAGSPVPVFVLVGGDTTEAPDHEDIHRDTRLEVQDQHGNIYWLGEIFIIPKSPLVGETVYEVGVTAYTGSGPATERFSKTWQFKTNAGGDGGNGRSTTLDELNAYRSQCGCEPVSIDPAYQRAAIKHAGYQKLPTEEMTHYEDTDDGKELYVADEPWDRVAQAISDLGRPPGASAWGVHDGNDIVMVAEGITSDGGHVSAVAALWNTVYHRQPKMRPHTVVFGSGNCHDAKTEGYSSDPALDETPYKYMTFNYGSDAVVPQTTSYWPDEGNATVPRRFYSDSENPDPVDPDNPNQTPQTPDRNQVGGPLHVILPTHEQLSGLTVVLRKP